MILDEKHRIRFFNKVTKTSDCWLWIGTKNKLGYGVFYISLKGYENYKSIDKGSLLHVIESYRLEARRALEHSPMENEK